MKNFPGFRCHETIREGPTFPGGLSHTSTTDELEIVMVAWVIKVHRSLFFVVSGDLERDDLELWDTRGHGENPSAVSVIIDVLLSVWVAHTSRVTSDDVELGTSNKTGLGVPLDLGGTGI